MYDLQKASMLKRISAWILDIIVLMIAVVGFASVISTVTGYDQYSVDMENYYAQYEEEYGVTFEITGEEYNAMTPETQANYDAAYEALIGNDDFLYAYNMVLSLTMVITTLGILLGVAVTEFIVPLCLKNGQTVGKKIFGLGVMRTNGVKMNNVSLFIRTFIGKYTVEIMIPVLVVMMLLFNITGLMGTLLVLAILIANIVAMIVTKTNSALHDLLADTVTVDLASQMIFETEEDLLAHKKQMSAENAAQASYF